MTSYYLDTSAVIRWILQSPNYYKDFGIWDSAISSVLMKVEFKRIMDRLLKLNVLDELQVKKANSSFSEFSNHVHWVKLDERILEKASERYEHSLGTLDALHLATCLLYKEEFETGNYFILTHDSELAKVAMSAGVSVKGLEKF